MGPQIFALIGSQKKRTITQGWRLLLDFFEDNPPWHA